MPDDSPRNLTDTELSTELSTVREQFREDTRDYRVLTEAMRRVLDRVRRFGLLPKKTDC